MVMYTAKGGITSLYDKVLSVNELLDDMFSKYKAVGVVIENIEALLNQ